MLDFHIAFSNQYPRTFHPAKQNRLYDICAKDAHILLVFGIIGIDTVISFRFLGLFLMTSKMFYDSQL